MMWLDRGAQKERKKVRKKSDSPPPPFRHTNEVFFFSTISPLRRREDVAGFFAPRFGLCYYCYFSQHNTLRLGIISVLSLCFFYFILEFKKKIRVTYSRKKGRRINRRGKKYPNPQKFPSFFSPSLLLHIIFTQNTPPFLIVNGNKYNSKIKKTKSYIFSKNKKQKYSPPLPLSPPPFQPNVLCALLFLSPLSILCLEKKKKKKKVTENLVDE